MKNEDEAARVPFISENMTHFSAERRLHADNFRFRQKSIRKSLF